MKKNIACIVGTRPEAIKMAPVIIELKRQDWCHVNVIFTGQHQDLALTTLSYFGINADIICPEVERKSSLSNTTQSLYRNISNVLSNEKFDYLVAQGDTSSVFVASVLSLYHGIKFAHVEAGLRTHNIHQPFPEEFNRRVASIVADWHFAPTTQSYMALIDEGVSPAKVFKTGNTVIDALYYMLNKRNLLRLSCKTAFENSSVLVTVHRRENFGEPLKAICEAVKVISSALPKTNIHIPVHPNPTVYTTVTSTLSGIRNVHLSDALSYPDLCELMNGVSIVLTDSGGIQEEAPALGKPVLVMRETTERPEAVESGCAKLVGSESAKKISSEAIRLLTDFHHYQTMIKDFSPYGDGSSALKIVEALKEK